MRIAGTRILFKSKKSFQVCHKILEIEDIEDWNIIVIVYNNA